MSKTKLAFRPTRGYPDGTKEAVIACIADGLTDTDTALRLGLAGGTIGRWKRSDPVFRAEYGIAKLSLKEKYLKVVLFMAESATSETVRLKAATWYLERKFPEEYAQHQVVHAPAERSPLDIMVSDETEDEEEPAGENAE